MGDIIRELVLMEQIKDSCFYFSTVNRSDFCIIFKKVQLRTKQTVLTFYVCDSGGELLHRSY